jgi:hypothetical protein
MAIVLMILGFIWWWPVGLLILAAMIASGRIGCGWRRPMFAGGGSMGCWNHDDHVSRWEEKMARMQDKMDRVRAKVERARTNWGTSSSGNRAFDEYRSETLKRLEEEQREFKEFLGRLRFAKDRAEFDQFMNERRNRPRDEGSQQPQPQA